MSQHIYTDDAAAYSLLHTVCLRGTSAEFDTPNKWVHKTLWRETQSEPKPLPLESGNKTNHFKHTTEQACGAGGGLLSEALWCFVCDGRPARDSVVFLLHETAQWRSRNTLGVRA